MLGAMLASTCVFGNLGRTSSSEAQCETAVAGKWLINPQGIALDTTTPGVYRLHIMIYTL